MHMEASSGPSDGWLKVNHEILLLVLPAASNE
jgi:hypothetical protein